MTPSDALALVEDHRALRPLDAHRHEVAEVRDTGRGVEVGADGIAADREIARDREGHAAFELVDHEPEATILVAAGLLRAGLPTQTTGERAGAIEQRDHVGVLVRNWQWLNG